MVLTESQKEFISRLVPWGQLIQKQTFAKAKFYRDIHTTKGFFASIFIADCILMSEWESHPASKPKYKTKHGNNLGLLEVDSFWSETSLKIDGKEYKSFESWEDYAIHFSDWVVFSTCPGSKDIGPKVLQSLNLVDQCREFSILRGELKMYNDKLINIIHDLNLTEFDLWR